MSEDQIEFRIAKVKDSNATSLPVDFTLDGGDVNLQYDHFAKKVWLCFSGQAAIRIRGFKEFAINNQPFEAIGPDMEIPKPPTYRHLLAFLNGLDSDQLDCNISVLTSEGEFQPVMELRVADDSQEMLDIGHPYLSVPDLGDEYGI